jgi:hypothetical protein
MGADYLFYIDELPSMKNTSKSYYLHIYNLKTGDVYLEDQEIYDGVQLAISSKGDYIALLSLDQVRFYHLEGKRLTYLYHYKLPQPAVCLLFLGKTTEKASCEDNNVSLACTWRTMSCI